MSVQFCPFCGKLLPQPDAPTCPFCGESLAPMAPMAPPAASDAESTSPSPAPHSMPLPPRPATPAPSQPVTAQPLPPHPATPPRPATPTQPVAPAPAQAFPPHPAVPTYPTAPTYPAFPPQPTAPTYSAVPPQPAVHPYMVPVVPVWGTVPGVVYAPGAMPLATPAAIPPVPFSLARVLGVTLGTLAFAVLGTYAVWQVVATTDFSTIGASSPSGWIWLLTQIFTSHQLSPLPPSLFATTFGYPITDTPPTMYVTLLHEREFALMVAALVPLALASAFWLGLRRLPEHRSGTWLDASFMCVALFIVAPCALGAENYGLARLWQQPDSFHSSALWPAILLAAVPGYLLVLLVLALVCAAVGTWGAVLFARWPRVAPGTAAPHRGGAPIFLITLVAVLAQAALYAWLTQSFMQGISIGWQWFPLAATLIITGAALSRALPEHP